MASVVDLQVGEAEKRQVTKGRILAFDREDARQFVAKLRVAFPTLKIIATGGPAVSVYLPLGTSKPEMSFPIHYRDFLEDEKSRSFVIWLEPENWHPEWHLRREASPYFDVMIVKNRPRFSFQYRDGATQPDRHIDFISGELSATYYADDAEHAKFLSKVWRIAASLSSNVHDAINNDTGEVRVKSGKTMCWSGASVRAWCAADPARRIDHILRPPSE